MSWWRHNLKLGSTISSSPLRVVYFPPASPLPPYRYSWRHHRYRRPRLIRRIPAARDLPSCQLSGLAHRRGRCQARPTDTDPRTIWVRHRALPRDHCLDTSQPADLTTHPSTVCTFFTPLYENYHTLPQYLRYLDIFSMSFPCGLVNGLIERTGFLSNLGAPPHWLLNRLAEDKSNILGTKINCIFIIN